MASEGKYSVGSVIGNLEILERPDPARDRKSPRFKVRCLGCEVVDYKWATTIYHIGRNGRPFGCRKCYDASMRRVDTYPALMRFIISYKSNAKSRGLPFDLSNEDFEMIASGDCFYCGNPPEKRNPPKDWQLPGYWSGLDRIDNSKGYSVDNCVPCCKHCNWAKKDLTQEEFYLWITRVISSGWYGVLG